MPRSCCVTLNNELNDVEGRLAFGKLVDAAGPGASEIPLRRFFGCAFFVDWGIILIGADRPKSSYRTPFPPIRQQDVTLFLNDYPFSVFLFWCLEIELLGSKFLPWS